MESPVVVDKPPEYGNGGNDRGFPFDEEDSGAWSQLASRHPDIAARLRAHPQTWARKRRPSGNEQTEDFGGFPFDDIPPEFREHLPPNWNRRFEEQPSGQPRQPYPQQQAPPQQHYPQPGQSQQYQAPPQQYQGPPQQYQAPPQHQYNQQQSYPPNYQQPPQQPHRVTISTQTEPDFITPPQSDAGVINSADCTQTGQPDNGYDDRNQRSMSAPPETHANQPNMSQSPPRSDQPHQNEHSNVRHIPIFVEGRNEPVINRAPHASEAKPNYQQAPPHPHVEREQFYPEEAPSFHHPPNFSRAFGSPFNKGFRQGPQPFTQQRAYPQAAFGRSNSPKRSQSPQLHPEEHYVKVPVHHEKPAQKPDSQSRPQTAPKPQQQPPPQQQQQQQPQPPPKTQTPPSNDPITQILAIQTDVLKLMTDVENFTGQKNDKGYLYLDEMLTRNLIKLDNIETEGKENIRQARREAIRCIQKCIAVLEAKATKDNAAPPQDVDMDNSNQGETKNGEVEMKEDAKDDAQVGEAPNPNLAPLAIDDNQPQASDTRPDQETGEPQTKEVTEQPAVVVDEKKTTKKKVVKKRDKSKDSSKDSNKKGDKKSEAMQVDDKGDKESSQTMDVDNAAASQ